MTPSTRPAFAVALTGGIASGKSTVQTLFEMVGSTVYDADMISREIVASGMPALHEIAVAFGANMLTPQGTLDRRRMRECVFADADAKRKLEQILHPRIRSELLARARACSADYCLLAIPLLAESANAYSWIDRVLVVDVPRAIQIARLVLRDDVTLDFAERALAAQASHEERLMLADDVIDNSGTPEDLPATVERLHRLYIALARNASE